MQHALRAYTPRDQKTVQAAAATFRPNPALDTAQAIGEPGMGEALASFLDDNGRPNQVDRAYIHMPGSQIGPIADAERKATCSARVATAKAAASRRSKRW